MLILSPFSQYGTKASEMPVQVALIEQSIKIEGEHRGRISADEVACITSTDLAPRLGNRLDLIVMILKGSRGEDATGHRIVSSQALDIIR